MTHKSTMATSPRGKAMMRSISLNALPSLDDEDEPQDPTLFSDPSMYLYPSLDEDEPQSPFRLHSFITKKRTRTEQENGIETLRPA